LDRAAESAAFVADPDAALRVQKEPVLLDEWQEVPGVLGAVKRAVDEDPHPGRFVLTGSVRAEMEQAMWPGTGRLVRLSMYGLTEVELRGSVRQKPTGFLDRLAQADPAALALPLDRPQLPEYVELSVRGAFPEVALRPLGLESRNTWLDSYLDQLLGRDAVAVDPRRDVGKMRTYFLALALSTAGMPQEKTLVDAAGINARTARAYDKLFADLFVSEQVPAWSSNRLSRLVATAKRYIVDPALAARAGGLTAEGILRDGDQLGRMIDSFAVAQLRPEVAISAGRHQMHHLRTKAGLQEIDLIVELEDGRILALDFKATAAPSGHDAKHLAWFRDQVGDRFLAGAVMHTGPAVFSLGDRILAIPLCAMWG
jgi:predicted AAA+ superfamily ATPase